MQLRIRRWIFLALIVSSFFIMIYGRHAGGPWVLFELLGILNFPEFLHRGDFISFIALTSVITGQLLFLFLGLRTVSGVKLWLLLISPLMVTIPLIIMLSELIEFQKQTINSVIPFFVMVVIFYAECTIKLTKSTQLSS